MKTETKKLQEFTIKGELIGTINLTDTYKKVKEMTEHKERHDFVFIINNGRIINHWNLHRVKEELFPIQVINPFGEDDSDDKEFLIQKSKP